MSAFRLLAAALCLTFCAPAMAVDHPTPSSGLVYTRIKSCRAFDTTKTAKIPANSAKSFLISGAGDYAAQGGGANGCGVPAAAQAVSVNITAINAAAAGSINAMAYAQTTSAATIRYPVSAPETEGVTVDLAQNKITLRTTNTVNAIGDVTGYWMQQIHGLMFTGSTAYIYSGTPSLVAVTYVSTGLIDVTVDRDVTYCTAIAVPYYDGYFASAQPVGGDKMRIRTSRPDNNTHLNVQTDTFVWLAINC